MPTLVEATETLRLAFQLVFGEQPPQWAWQLTGVCIMVWIGLTGLSKVVDAGLAIHKRWRDDVWPLLYRPEVRRRAELRRRFADHVESELRRLNNQEDWQDHRYAELEAEVEAEGRPTGFKWPGWVSGGKLRRERSLSAALQGSGERLVLLEGEPGSGKSVALRHVAQLMARSAMQARNVQSIVPLYVNLRQLSREEGEPVDAGLIRRFVLSVLNRPNDRDIHAFLSDEFDEGMRAGTWIFLFDSFDEIPEVLSSVEADDTIARYGDAVLDFLQGMNKCRGVVASRLFRGPRYLGWPRFRILPLSETRKIELIRKSNLSEELQIELFRGLGVQEEQFRSFVVNPMFLGLLCEHLTEQACSR